MLALAAGCMHPGPQDPARVGPFFVPGNHAGEAWLGGLRRVVLLPVAAAGVASPETAAELDGIVATALQHQNRFEVVTVPREESRRRFGAEAFSSSAALPHDLLATLKARYAADAVMFVDLTNHSAYRPLSIGFRSKLATIDGSRLVWTFDAVFSADNPEVANAARNFFLGRDRHDVPADFTKAALQSPGRFATYAASAMFRTLPPVTPAPARQ